MSGAYIKPSPGGLEELLKTKAGALVEVLEQGDIGSAMNLINELQEARHNAFYNEVGHLTRGLHEAIKSFSSEVGADHVPEDARESVTSMTDASDRLNYVIELTEKTAHDTMDRVDKALTLVDRLDEQSSRFQELLSLVGQLEGEFEGLRGVYDRTCQLKEESEQTTDTLRSQLTDILVSQGFQDITGQLIRRVLTLVTHVESHLVQVMEMAAQVERLTGVEQITQTSAPAGVKNKKDKDPIEAEGPQLASRKNQDDVACNQDDVDDLLSSLGF